MKLLCQIGGAMGESISLTCQDWAKAAYRFFSNDRISEVDVLSGHFETRERTAATDGPILVLHDTTEFSYKRESADAIGITKSILLGNARTDRPVRTHGRHGPEGDRIEAARSALPVRMLAGLD